MGIEHEQNLKGVSAQAGTQLTCHSAGCGEHGSSMLRETSRAAGENIFPYPTLTSRVRNNRQMLRVGRWQVNCDRGGGLIESFLRIPFLGLSHFGASAPSHRFQFSAGHLVGRQFLTLVTDRRVLGRRFRGVS